MSDPNPFAARLADLGVPAPWHTTMVGASHGIQTSSHRRIPINACERFSDDDDLAILVCRAVNEKAGVP